MRREELQSAEQGSGEAGGSVAAFARWSAKAAPVYEQLALRGRTQVVAAHLAELEPARPATTPQVMLLLDAFYDLQSERAIGMQVGPIPASAIRAWARDHDLDYDATQVLKRVIRVVEHQMAPAKE